MKKYLMRTKQVFVLVLFTLVLSGMTAQAKTVTKKEPVSKSIYSTGSEMDLNDVAGFQINGKSYSKSKKKVKTVCTGSDQDDFTYHTSSYFNSSGAYATYDEYENAKYNAIKYVGSKSYTLRFVKKGTYTITYWRFSKEEIDYDYGGYDDRGSYYYFTVNGTKNPEKFYRKTVSNNNTDYYATYYQSDSGKIYASGYEGYTSASLKADYNGVQRLYYAPKDIVKTVYTKQIKVLGTGRVVASVALGKSKISASGSSSAYKSTSKHTSKKFLSGNSGKLAVKMADKNYTIQSILIKTYGADGKPVFTKIGNNKTVTYGANKASYSYTSEYSGYAYKYDSIYKPTTVYVSYKDKFTGAFTNFDVVNENGTFKVKSTYRYSGDAADNVSIGEDLVGGCYEEFTFYKK